MHLHRKRSFSDVVMARPLGPPASAGARSDVQEEAATCSILFAGALHFLFRWKASYIEQGRGGNKMGLYRPAFKTRRQQSLALAQAKRLRHSPDACECPRQIVLASRRFATYICQNPIIVFITETAAI